MTIKLEDLPQDLQDLITYTWRIDSEDGNPPEPIEELVKRYQPEKKTFRGLGPTNGRHRPT